LVKFLLVHSITVKGVMGVIRLPESQQDEYKRLVKNNVVSVYKSCIYCLAMVM